MDHDAGSAVQPNSYSYLGATARCHASHPSSKVVQVSRLDIHRARTGEATDHTFASFHAGQPSTPSSLDRIFAVPSDEMAIVDNVLLALLKL